METKIRITLVHVKQGKLAFGLEKVCSECGFRAAVHPTPSQVLDVWVKSKKQVKSRISYNPNTYACTDPLAQVAIIQEA